MVKTQGGGCTPKTKKIETRVGLIFPVNSFTQHELFHIRLGQEGELLRAFLGPIFATRHPPLESLENAKITAAVGKQCFLHLFTFPVRGLEIEKQFNFGTLAAHLFQIKLQLGWCPFKNYTFTWKTREIFGKSCSCSAASDATFHDLNSLAQTQEGEGC